MESAHLTSAHEHVRTAATATLDKSVATAGQEHDLAAAAFHEAAQDTRNAEVRVMSTSGWARSDRIHRRCASSACSRTTTASSLG